METGKAWTWDLVPDAPAETKRLESHTQSCMSLHVDHILKVVRRYPFRCDAASNWQVLR